MEKEFRYDVLIRGGHIIDGTNKKAFKADVAIKADRIVAIGDLSSADAKQSIDAENKVIAPGFIDAHTHDDNVLLKDGDMIPKVSQGVTTVVTGNCGISLAPLSHPAPPPPLDLLGNKESYIFPAFVDYLSALKENPPSVNAICLVGHTTLRAGALQDLAKPASASQIDDMQKKVDEALKAGAAGVSTGTFYQAARAAPTEEIIEVCRPLGAAQGVYATHMRSEADAVIEALEESFFIGKELGVRVIISHHKVIGKNNFGRTKETLSLISSYMEEQEIGLDVYPYTAGSTILEKEQAAQASKILVTWCKPYPEYTGRDLSEIRQEHGWSLEEAIEKLSPAGGIYFMMDEQDVQRIMKYKHSMIGSDGLPHDTHPHPRLWGTFPRVLGHYSRDLGLFPLETAVWKMTGLTAKQFGIKERGVVQEGAYADLVVFDPETVADRATFEEPLSVAAGIDAVLVNGSLVWRPEGGHTGARVGRVLNNGH